MQFRFELIVIGVEHLTELAGVGSRGDDTYSSIFLVSLETDLVKKPISQE